LKKKKGKPKQGRQKQGVMADKKETVKKEDINRYTTIQLPTNGSAISLHETSPSCD
jgi:hypothetical protein